MTAELFLILLARWLHILSAALALGVPLYVRFVLMPAMGVLEEESRSRLKEALAKRWRIIVYVLIVIFLATGFYNFLGPHARWRGFGADLKFRYHLYFGIKLVVALAMFFLSSALAGRSASLKFIRDKSSLWLTVLILLGLFIVVISGTMRFMQ